jgi:hypothetical protein
MLNIEIKTIPHARQRYETIGDWTIGPNGHIHIYVSELGDWRMEFAVAIHELVEMQLCRFLGITQTEVDDFDMAYEAQRVPDNYDEPGDDPRAPYHRQHCVATGIERIMVCMLGLSWKEYEARINSLQFCK